MQLSKNDQPAFDVFGCGDREQGFLFSLLEASHGAR